MIFTPTEIQGVFLVALEPACDERGSFARTWCADEFARRGLDASLAQCSISCNRARGTLRGLHYQAAPHAETKLVRVTRGAAFDVVVDARPASATFGQWVGIELSHDNHLAVYIPGGCAHGLQTLVDDTEVLYQISTPYRASAARGVRWNDEALKIAWPLPVTCLAPRDTQWPDLATACAPPREVP